MGRTRASSMRSTLTNELIQSHEAGESLELTSVGREQTEEHDAVCASAKTRCLQRGHDRAEAHVAHEHRKDDRESFVLPS